MSSQYPSGLSPLIRPLLGCITLREVDGIYEPEPIPHIVDVNHIYSFMSIYFNAPPSAFQSFFELAITLYEDDLPVSNLGKFLNSRHTGIWAKHNLFNYSTRGKGITIKIMQVAFRMIYDNFVHLNIRPVGPIGWVSEEDYEVVVMVK